MSPTRRDGFVVALTVAVGLALLLVPTTQGTLTGSVTNGSNTVANTTYAKCATAARMIDSAFFVNPLDESSGTSAADASGNSRAATYNGGVTKNQAGPCPAGNGRSVLLNGTSGFIHNPASQTAPQVFSVQIWFKTTSGYAGGGRLIGFGNGSGTTQSGSYDRHIYMTTSGTLVFGVFPGAIKTVTGTTKYNDGNWHHAVATLAPSGNANPGMRLYVDGTLIGSDSAVVSAENFTGFWRMGWDNLNTWPSAPPSPYYFTGNLAYGAVFTTVLTPAQVTSLYNAKN